jgi:hypothetical protein
MAQRRKAPVKLDSYLGYLDERWQAGCRNRLQLWREIREQGFDGTHQLVYAWTKHKGYLKKGISNPRDGDTSPSVCQPIKTRP